MHNLLREKSEATLFTLSLYLPLSLIVLFLSTFFHYRQCHSAGTHQMKLLANVFFRRIGFAFRGLDSKRVLTLRLALVHCASYVCRYCQSQICCPR